ncbi:MAG: DUF366 family protein [Bdellovibrionales bacterium]
MKALWLDREFKYDGSQLRSLFAYLEHGVLGDSIVAWQGPCEVTLEHMVDGEDQRAGAEIRGDKMVHFIIEKFDCSLLAAVALQRLLAAIVKDVVQEKALSSATAQVLHRDGDDIYHGQNKFSISIATVSPTSALIHFAVNVVNEGTPVPTLALQDLKLDAADFAKTVLDRFTAETKSVVQATQKVHWVR